MLMGILERNCVSIVETLVALNSIPHSEFVRLFFCWLTVGWNAIFL